MAHGCSYLSSVLLLLFTKMLKWFSFFYPEWICVFVVANSTYTYVYKCMYVLYTHTHSQPFLYQTHFYAFSLSVQSITKGGFCNTCACDQLGSRISVKKSTRLENKVGLSVPVVRATATFSQKVAKTASVRCTSLFICSTMACLLF